ncbi:leucine rich adaptor protein 1-like [Scleropages formosus]|uniref:Leucine rich adaptor protein 1-like n=1 Tax=Scleropages formosus TaxID=113540 RepID=A0A0P7VC90_SCLFO|nr:leucine rich adaptor protein 1-like [Scleropages formosus]
MTCVREDSDPFRAAPHCRVTARAMDAPDFKDVEAKLGRRVPAALARSIADDTVDARHGAEQHVDTAGGLHSKMLFLRREMENLRAIDVRLMQQFLSINEGIESIKWVMEERSCLASRDGSLAGSLYSLLESPDTSPRGSRSSLLGASDGADGFSVGSFLDTLADEHLGQAVLTDIDSSSHQPTAEDFSDKPPVSWNVDPNEYHSLR